MLDSNNKEGEDPPVMPMEALVAFVMTMEVVGLRGDGQLLIELEGVRGGEGWRLSLVRLVERNRAMEVQAVCVVPKAKKRARSGTVCRMQALVVKEELRGRGLAAEALSGLQAELGGAGWCVLGRLP